MTTVSAPQRRLSSASAMSDRASEGKKIVTHTVQCRDSARSDAVSEATEMLSHGKWRRVSNTSIQQSDPIHGEEHRIDFSEVQSANAFTFNHCSTSNQQQLRSSCTGLKHVKLDINIPEQVAALVWNFGPEGGAWLNRIKEGVPMPDNHGLEAGDELISINEHNVRGFPKQKIEHIWMETQEDMNVEFFCLTLSPA
jgi:hypothetical protein